MLSNRYEIDEKIYITDQLTFDDIPAMIKYLNNSTIYANTHAIAYPYTQKDGEDFINMIRSSSSNLTQYFTIRLHANDELIGACGLHRSPTNERTTGIGYWLAEPYWHRGLMPKVITKVIEIGKKEWTNLVRIEGHTFTWNKASMRVLEKCGFTFEETLPKHMHKNGEDLDSNLYALIVE